MRRYITYQELQRTCGFRPCGSGRRKKRGKKGEAHTSMEESSPSRGEAGKSVNDNFIRLSMTELKKKNTFLEGLPFVARQLSRS